MELVPGFMAFVQGLSSTMTAPTFASLTTVLTGWVFAGRPAVTAARLPVVRLEDRTIVRRHARHPAATQRPTTGFITGRTRARVPETKTTTGKRSCNRRVKCKSRT